MSGAITKTLILSPHLDDAVLSCYEHISVWKKNKDKIKIVTIFSKFGKVAPSQRAKKYLKESGFNDIKKFQKARINEDLNAINSLNVDSLHLNYIDGWFRTFAGKPVYPNESLFQGKISPKDSGMINDLIKKLRQFVKFDKIIIPLGVGRHVDHIITRLVGERVFSKKHLMYFVDTPYASHIKNWQPASIIKFLTMKKSLIKNCEAKKQTIDYYKSQTPLLFKTSKLLKYEAVLYQ